MTPAPIRVNATANAISLDHSALTAALAALPAPAPVVVMIHGYRFSPAASDHNCPHGHIFSLEPPQGDRKAISWPRHLGLDGQNGLAVGFGWPARGNLLSAARLARRIGQRLAEFATLVGQIDPGRPIDVICHSLGARVALSALPHVPAGLFRRFILLAGAETRKPALAAMASPAGRTVEVFNITSRENDVFDLAFELAHSCGLDNAIGFGLRNDVPNWLDLQIDQTATLAALGCLGHALPPATGRICHWSPYLRPGTFPLYRALIDARLSMAELRAHLPDRPDRRWSRLLSRSQAAWFSPLPA